MQGDYPMNELLNKLLQAEVLTEDTRKELQSAFAKQLNEAVQTARQEAQAAVTAELNEQWINERETLIEALDAQVTEALSEELKELKADIERFRDLEAEHSTKLVEAKEEMAGRVKQDLQQLIENLDTWMEIRLTAELSELKEDLEQAKKRALGQRIFEAFVAEFKQNYVAEGSTEKQLQESQTRLADANSALKAAEAKAAKLERKMAMESVLSPLTGRSREVMEAILKNVDTPLLEQAYTTYIGRVVRESSTDSTSEKEKSVLAEGKKVDKTPRGVIKTGDDVDRLNESVVVERQQQSGNTDMINRMRALGGLRK